MPLITAIFVALSELLTSGRPAKAVAEENGLTLPDLNAALPKIQPHTWQGKLAAALADPTTRPDLIPLLVHLARLERHHADLIAQFERSQELTNQIRSKDTIDLDKFIKAEAFTFKIQSAIGKALREIQRAEIRLEKAQKPVPESANTKSASGKQKSNELFVTPTVSLENSPEPVTTHQPQATTSPDPLVESALLRHRQRIKHTAPQDRPALIAELVEQERKRKAA